VLRLDHRLSRPRSRCATHRHANANCRDPEGRTSIAAFEHGLAQLGWIVGRNVRIDYRWAIDSAEKDKAAVAEFQALSPDVVVARTRRTVTELPQMMPTVAIVFTMIYDPAARGFVENLAHPGGVGEAPGRGCSQSSSHLREVNYACASDTLGGRRDKQ
jgi:hypothetical protein